MTTSASKTCSRMPGASEAVAFTGPAGADATLDTSELPKDRIRKNAPILAPRLAALMKALRELRVMVGFYGKNDRRETCGHT